MIRLVYNLLWPIGLLFFLPRYLRKMFRRGGYRRDFGQRFAFYDRSLREQFKTRRVIWLHAVSVGEVAIALKLARALTALQPATNFALTTTTTTAFTFAKENAPSNIDVLYTPLDFWPVMKRAFATICPERVVLVEAEVWPNFVAEARSRKIPLALVNARLSPRSEQRFRRFRSVVAPVFQSLDLVCVPESSDVERWTSFGIHRDRIRHTGSIKYDPDQTSAANNADHLSRSDYVAFADPKRLVLFGGSTHRGEEEILARIFLKLRHDFPGLVLFLAPRHVERAGEVKQQLEKLSLGVQLCSQLSPNLDTRADCFLLDRTGELRSWYAVASVVFVGKSLTSSGGQNPVEPIAAGKPVVFGPHMENFTALAQQLISNQGAVQVEDEQTLTAEVASLLGNANRRESLVQNARRVIDSHRGATIRTADLVLALKKNG